MRDPFGSPPEPVIEAVDEAEVEARRRGLRGFGALARQLREDAGISMAEMCRPIGAMVSELSAIETGKTRATAEWVRYIADALGRPFTEMFDLWDREAPGEESRLTVAEARAMVQRLLAAGVECPCCGRLCRETRRSLTPTMARFVVWLVDQYRGEPLNPKSWLRNKTYGGDYAKVTHWGLAHRLPGREPRWEPTDKGRLFARGQTKVRRVAIFWRNQVLRWEGGTVTIKDVLGDDPEIPERGVATQTLPGVDRA